MSSNDELIAKMQLAARNPIAVARTIVADIEARYEGGLELANPLNPYVHLVDMMSSLAAAGCRTNKQLNHRHYPRAANNFEDTYHHMSDADYIDIFASPGTTTMTMMYQYDELISRMVDTGSGNLSKLTIGKHTKWSVAGMDFGILYPIDIRMMSNGRLQIVYDGSQDNPMGALESNEVEWGIRDLGRIGGGKMVEVQIPVRQHKRTVYKATLSGASQFSKEYEFEDQYYFCRAYMATRTGEWKEILTTHSDQIFNPATPTLQLKLLEGRLRVTLPYVYYQTGLADTELRIDIYSTKGPVEMSLHSYRPNSFEVRYADDDSVASRRFIAPLTNFTTSTCYAAAMLIGGSNAITLNELKDRIANNSLGRNTIPVTRAQIINELNKLGFGSVLSIDNITDRIYLATRKLPTPEALLSRDVGNLSVNPAGATIMMLSGSFDELAKVPGVLDNDDRLTLSPSVLYRNRNGLLEPVGTDEVEDMQTLALDQLVAKVNNDSLLYSPLHYVMDISSTKFETRPYYFGNPETSGRNFIDDNETTGIGVNSSVLAIEKNEDGSGWRLILQTNTDETFKSLDDDKVHVQIGVEDAEGTGMVFMDGTLIGKNADNERVYEFLITTNWDVNSQHHLTVNSFNILDGNRPYPIELKSKLHVFYLAEGVRGFNYRTRPFDAMYATFFYTEEVSGIYYETFDVKFADNLDGLWTRSRSVPGTEQYLRYQEDVLDTWEEDVFEMDPENPKMRKIVMNDGVLEFVKIHEKGDLKLVDGQPVVKHYKDTVIHDSYGNPQVVSTRKVVQQTDLFLVDGAYYFVTGDADVEYAKRLPETLVIWIRDYLNPFLKRSHNQTRVFLHPQTTVGEVTMLVSGGRELKMEASQTLHVEVCVRKTIYKDINARRSIEGSVTKTVSQLLEREVVAVDGIESMLRATLGDDVISIKLSGLGDDSGYRTFTAIDGGGRLCIGHSLSLGSDGNLTIDDSISFSFVEHVA